MKANKMQMTPMQMVREKPVSKKIYSFEMRRRALEFIAPET